MYSLCSPVLCETCVSLLHTLSEFTVNVWVMWKPVRTSLVGSPSLPPSLHHPSLGFMPTSFLIPSKRCCSWTLPLWILCYSVTRWNKVHSYVFVTTTNLFEALPPTDLLHTQRWTRDLGLSHSKDFSFCSSTKTAARQRSWHPQLWPAQFVSGQTQHKTMTWRRQQLDWFDHNVEQNLCLPGTGLYQIVYKRQKPTVSFVHV